MSDAKFCTNPQPGNIFTADGFEEMFNNIYVDEYRMATAKLGRMNAGAALVLREIVFKSVALNILDHLLPAGNA